MLDPELIVDAAVPEAVATEWDDLAVANGLPLMAPAWIGAWWRHLAPERAEPRIVAVRDRGRLVGLAPFYVERGRRGSRIDYRLPGIDLAVRLAPLATPGREWEVAESVAHALATAAPHPDVVALEGMPVACHWLPALREGWPGPLRPPARVYHVQSCPTVQLDMPSFDDWFAGRSSKLRTSMRRLRRRFEEAGGQARLATAATLADDVATLLRLHAGRWQERGASNLVAHGDAFAAMLVDAGTALLASGRFRLWIQEVDGEPIGADLYLAAGGEILGFNGGWDERWRRLSPPLLATLRAIEDGFERGDRRIDLGLGEQSHKARFADGSDPVAWGVLLAPGRRLPLTRARVAPMLARQRARRFVRHALPAEQQDRLRALRARIRR